MEEEEVVARKREERADACAFLPRSSPPFSLFTGLSSALTVCLTYSGTDSQSLQTPQKQCPDDQHWALGSGRY